MERLKVGKYEIVHSHELGKGGFGTVYEAKVPGRGDVLAAKCIRSPSSALTAALEKHIPFLRELHHENVLTIHDFILCEDAGVKNAWLILECCQGGQLQEYLVKHDLVITQQLDLMVQLADALVYLHSRKPPVIHRDVKPANVLISVSPNGQTLKLSDLELAVQEGSDELETTVGTILIMPPEMFEGITNSTESDVYSCGVTYYYIMYKTFPSIGDQSVGCAMAEHVAAKRPIPEVIGILPTDSEMSAAIKSLANKMMQAVPKKRPTMETVKHTLAHIKTMSTSVRAEEMVAQSDYSTPPPSPPPRSQTPPPSSSHDCADSYPPDRLPPPPPPPPRRESSGSEEDYEIRYNGCPASSADERRELHDAVKQLEETNKAMCKVVKLDGIEVTEQAGRREDVTDNTPNRLSSCSQEKSHDKESLLSRAKSMFPKKRHVVQMVARQKADDLATLYINCVRSKHVAGLMESLRQNGFTEGPMPSNECSLRDGEELLVSVTGDLQIAGEYAQTVRFHHSHDSCKQQVFIESCKPTPGDSRGYVLFSIAGTQAELCKLPIRLKAQAPFGGRGDAAGEMRSTAPTTDASLPPPGDQVDNNSTNALWDKRFKFAVKCVLSCPIALSRWKELSGKLEWDNALASAVAASDVVGWPHEVLQGTLHSWYEQTDKLYALQKLKTALGELGANGAVEGIILLEEVHGGPTARSENEKLFTKAVRIVLSSPVALRSWKMIGRDLGLAEGILADIEMRTMCSIQGACEAMLTEWFSRLGREQVIADALIQAMLNNKINNVAESLNELL